MTRIYANWAGNPKGIKEDLTRCIESVFSESDYISGQCSRKRGHGPDGLYCKQHGKKEEERRERRKADPS